MVEALLALLLACIGIVVLMVLIFGVLSGSSLLDPSDEDSWTEPIFNALIIVGLLAFFSWFNLSLVGASVPVQLNVTGVIVPILVSSYLLVNVRLGWRKYLLVTITIALLGFLLTELHPEGVFIPIVSWMAIVVAAAVLSYRMVQGDPTKAAALAYVASSLGMLFGGDVLRMAQYPLYEGPFAIGVGGIMDFVFITGVVAVALIWTLHYLMHSSFASLRVLGRA